MLVAMPLSASKSLSAGLITIAACSMAILSVGCQSFLFAERERTSLITPGMRIAAIREMGPRSRNQEKAQQLATLERLVEQIRTEPDPIVRLAIQETVSQFDHPLALAVLEAGLNDDDREVRLACCRMLGNRGATQAVTDLGRVAAQDQDIDVRMAAVDALGAIGTPAGVKALAVALNDRNPAMQYAAVEAAKSASGEKLGNDVQQWREYVASLPGGPSPTSGSGETSIATQPDSSRYQ
jgi:HEAT repeat protein